MIAWAPLCGASIHKLTPPEDHPIRAGEGEGLEYQSFACVWDALESTPEAAAEMRGRFSMFSLDQFLGLECRAENGA